MALELKLVFADEVHRVTVPDAMTLGDLWNVVGSRFDQRVMQTRHRLTYEDREGDRVVLHEDADVQRMIRQARQTGQPARVLVVPRGSQLEPAGSAPQLPAEWIQAILASDAYRGRVAQLVESYIRSDAYASLVASLVPAASAMVAEPVFLERLQSAQLGDDPNMEDLTQPLTVSVLGGAPVHVPSPAPAAVQAPQLGVLIDMSDFASSPTPLPTTPPSTLTSVPASTNSPSPLPSPPISAAQTHYQSSPALPQVPKQAAVAATHASSAPRSTPVDRNSILRNLRDMGFSDNIRNEALIDRYGLNLSLIVEKLTGR